MSTQIQRADQFKAALELKEEAFAGMAPKNMVFAQEANFAMMAIQKNPQLANCDPGSFASAVYQVAITGLSLNPTLGHAYLVPKGGKAEFRPGYQGLITIMIKCGAAKKIESRAVYQNDEFELNYGDKPSVTHKPTTGDRGSLVAFYGVATLPNDEKLIEYMTLDEVLANAKRGDMNKSAKVTEDLKGPWGTDLGEMGRKTLVRRLWKYVPKENISSDIMSRIEAAFDGDNADAMEARGASPSSMDYVDFEIVSTPVVSQIPGGEKSAKVDAAPAVAAVPAIPVASTQVQSEKGGK
jgi:recombination protein RecT